MLKRSNGEKIFNVCNIIFFFICSLAMILPLWNILASSFVGQGEYYAKPLVMWPSKFYFASYRLIFSGHLVKDAFITTVSLTVIGTIISLIITTMLAYALSKKFLPGRNIMLTLITATLFFEGGLIPFYLLVQRLHLMNTFWVLILPSAVNTFNFIIIKSFFGQLPVELEESAKLDGASDIAVFFRIVLPLSMPVLATFALFYGVSYWNTWFNVSLFIRTQKLFTLQYVLRQLVVQNVKMTELSNSGKALGIDTSKGTVFEEGIKMATIVVATVPILIVYPFLQKYFVKGVMIGSIKG